MSGDYPHYAYYGPGFYSAGVQVNVYGGPGRCVMPRPSHRAGSGVNQCQGTVATGPNKGHRCSHQVAEGNVKYCKKRGTQQRY